MRAWFIAVCAATLAAGAALAQSPGPFTAAQATRGAALYQGRCAGCHGDQLQGDGNGIAPPLASLEFRANWGGLPLSTLLDRIRQESQQNDATPLGRSQQVDVLALILSRNRLPAGDAELTADAPAMSRLLSSFAPQ